MKKIICLLIVLVLVNVAFGLEVSVNNYDPAPAEAGRAVDVWFKVENPIDDTEEDISISIVPKDGLRLTTGEVATKRIGIMPGRSSQTVRYRLLVADDAFEGSHNIEVSLTKGGQAEIKRTLSIEVAKKDIKTVELEIGDIESDPTRIKPDDEDVKLDVTIQNLGDGRARGVKAELVDLPEGVTLSESYSGTSLLGNIEADSTSVATFYINIDKTVSPKEYTSNVKTTYKYKPDEDAEEILIGEEMLPLRLAIKPVPIFEITKAELSHGNLTAGDKDVKLRLTIKNVGQEKGESVRVKAYGKTEQPFTYDKSSDFVAPILEPGEEGQGTIEFKIDDDANLQKYYIDIEIKSLVGDDVITYNTKVPVTVANSKPNSPFGVILIGAVIIIGFIIYMVARKKMKKKTKPKKVSGNYGKNYLDKMKGD